MALCPVCPHLQPTIGTQHMHRRLPKQILIGLRFHPAGVGVRQSSVCSGRTVVYSCFRSGALNAPSLCTRVDNSMAYM